METFFSIFFYFLKSFFLLFQGAFVCEDVDGGGRVAVVGDDEVGHRLGEEEEERQWDPRKV